MRKFSSRLETVLESNYYFNGRAQTTISEMKTITKITKQTVLNINQAEESSLSVRQITYPVNAF